MSNEVGTELTLDNDSKYIVVDDFTLNNKEYLYLVNDGDTNSVALVGVEGDTLYVIEDDDEYDKVYEELVERHKDEISDFLEEADEN